MICKNTDSCFLFTESSLQGLILALEAGDLSGVRPHPLPAPPEGSPHNENEDPENAAECGCRRIDLLHI